MMGLVFLLLWICINDSPASIKNFFFAQCFPDFDTMVTFAKKLNMQFAPGLWDMLKSREAQLTVGLWLIRPSCCIVR